MNISLPPSVSSPQDLSQLTQEIREYSAWFRQFGNAAKRNTSYHTGTPELSDTAHEVIRLHATLHTQQELDDLTRDLEAIRAKARVISITLAAPASPDIKTAIITWTRKSIASDVLINFKFNSNILGGLVLRVGSHVYDWSFRPALMKNRERIAEQFHV